MTTLDTSNREVSEAPALLEPADNEYYSGPPEPPEELSVRFLASFNSNIGLASINLERGFMNKSMYVATALENNNITIAVLCDLGLQPQELDKHFMHKGEGKWLAKPYVMKGFQVIVNVDEDNSWVAMAIRNDKLDLNNVHITYGISGNRGRCISIKVTLDTGQELVVMGVYAPPEANENGEFIHLLTDKIWDHKVANRVVIVAGDFNMDKYNANHGNMWCRDLDGFVADSRRAWSGGTFEPSWWADGRPGIGAILDYILIDHDLISQCVWGGNAWDMNALSDHCMITARIKLKWVEPVTLHGDYTKVMDIGKLTSDVIPGLQEDVCDMSNTYIPLVQEILEADTSLTKAMDFNTIVNHMSAQLQDIATKWCPPEKPNPRYSKLPAGMTKEVREINREVKVCRSAMSKLSAINISERHLHSVTFQTKATVSTERTHVDRWTWKYQVLRKQQELRLCRQKEGAAGQTKWQTLRSQYIAKVATLRQAVANIEGLNNELVNHQEDYTTSELLNSGLAAHSVQYLYSIGITKWNQLTNWDNSDLMSLYTLRTITKAARIGAKGWTKASEMFRHKIRITAPASRLLGELEEQVVQEAVLLIIHADQGVIARNTSGVVPISWRPTAQKWLQQVNIEHEFSEAALLVKIDKVQEFLLGLASSMDTNIYCQLAEARMGNNWVPKVVEASMFEWAQAHHTNVLERLNTGEQILISKVTTDTSGVSSEPPILTESEPPEAERWLQLLQKHRVALKNRINESIKLTKIKQIQKATQRQAHNLRKSAKKFIRRRRALLEGGRAKLSKLLINGQITTDKTTILQETEKFFVETGKEVPTSNSTRYKFLEICRETAPNPTPESIEMLLADITISEVVTKVFKAANNTAPGRDGIPYDLLKRMPDCFFQLLTTIFNVIWIKGYCPEAWRTGDVFLLPKTQDPETLKNWRPICLQAVIYKTLTAIISDRMLNFAMINNIISNEQKGFCPVSGCVDHVGLLLNAIENFRQNHGELYLIFIDFCNAYGTVSYKRLLEVLTALGFPQKVTLFLEAVLTESSYVVHTAVGQTAPITLMTGLKQGDPSSPVLFILFIEALIRMLKDQCKGFEFKYPFASDIDSLGVMAFADDFLLLSDNMPDSVKAIEVIEDFEQWSGMRINHGKCAVMATVSNSKIIKDIPVTFKIRGEPLPYYTQDTAYKYLGFFESVNGNQKQAFEHISTKLQGNVTLIDSMGVSPWDKTQLASWLLAAIPMYYLVHGRLNKGDIKALTVFTRKAIRKWLHAASLCSGVIHLPRMLHGLGITDFQDVDEERKLTTFSQFLHSNDSNLRNSTVANLQMEWRRQRWIIDRDNVLISNRTVKTAVNKRKYTLWYSIEPLLVNMNLAIHIRYATTECFCALPAGALLETFQCQVCHRHIHKLCDPKGKSSLRCCLCVKNIEPPSKRNIEFVPTRYQDNRYNWNVQLCRRSNPMWDWLLSQSCQGKSHYLYRLENGVWGVHAKKILWDHTIEVDIPNGMSVTNALYHTLLATQAQYQGGRAQVQINHDLVVKILSNWMFKWVNSYLRSSAGVEPTTWKMCKQWLQYLETIRPGWIMFEKWSQERTDTEFEPDQVDEEPAVKPAIWIHKGGVQLTPPMVAQYVKNLQAERWLAEWASKKAQGVVPRANTTTIASTSGFLTNQLVPPTVVVTFLKASLDILPTRARKYTWGYADSPRCFLCNSPSMNIWHCMCACPMLNGFYKRRHNAVLQRIVRDLAELENLGIVIIDRQWDTLTPWRYNMPDIVLLVPMDQSMLPAKWRELLEPADSLVVDLAICADRHLEERYEYKCKKYEPLAAIIDEENERVGVDTGALIFGAMGSVHASVAETLIRLGIADKQVMHILKDVNAILAEECHNIWCYLSGLDKLET